MGASKKNTLKPWQVKTWCIGKASAQYVAKMEDVLDVYARPYDPKRPVVCIDEGGKELRDTPNGALDMQPGQPVRQDYEYERLGKANLFLSVEPLAGKRHLRVTERHTGKDFAHELKNVVDDDYADAEIVVVVCDNLATHGAACLYATFEPAEARRIAAKIEWHFTPEHGSWLNMAECELSVLARQCLNRRIKDIATIGGMRDNQLVGVLGTKPQRDAGQDRLAVHHNGGAYQVEAAVSCSARTAALCKLRQDRIVDSVCRHKYVFQSNCVLT